jgi:hypothetical protein
MQWGDEISPLRRSLERLTDDIKPFILTTDEFFASNLNELGRKCWLSEGLPERHLQQAPAAIRDDKINVSGTGPALLVFILHAGVTKVTRSISEGGNARPRSRFGLLAGDGKHPSSSGVG